MPRKPKFRPRITRVKLNPEQAVLQCGCYDGGYQYSEGEPAEGQVVCWPFEEPKALPQSSTMWNESQPAS